VVMGVVRVVGMVGAGLHLLWQPLIRATATAWVQT